MSYAKFQKTTFENPPFCPPQYTIVQGEVGVPRFFFGSVLLIFGELGAHAKFQDPRTPLLREKKLDRKGEIGGKKRP